jgi:hypothetical protein
MLSPESARARLRLGALVRQRCDARGAWVATEAIDSPTEREREVDRLLSARAASVADALFGAGYFGPFGIDAFTYRGEDGALRFHELSEINARYSMGFGVGFAADRA